jgi:AcrR family transcriptional regulator
MSIAMVVSDAMSPKAAVSPRVALSAKRASPEKAGAKKRAYHHGDLARALVTAALEIIGKRGPEAFTLREVAAAVGVTHGAAYRHFADKEALLAAVAEEGYRGLAQKLASAANAAITEPTARVRALGAAYVAFAMARPAHYRVMWGPRVNEDGRFPSLEAAIAEAFALVIAEFERGQAKGAFRDDEPARDLSIAFWVAAHGYIELVLRRRLKVKSEAVAVAYFGRLLTPFLDGLTARPRAASRGRA